MGIFEKSLAFVKHWNSDPTKTFKVGINEFADISDEEFASKFLVAGAMDEDLPISSRASDLAEIKEGRFVGESLQNGAMHENSHKALPDHVDWSSVSGKIYKQGVCAACYTFTTNAAIEGAYKIKTGKTLPELSDQELLACSRPFQNHGCRGGTMEKSFHYIMDAQEHDRGITLAKDYAYSGTEGSCKRDKFKTINIKLAGYRKIKKSNEADLEDAVAERPVAVGIDAHHPAFKLYRSGVFDIDYCTTHLTHAVLVVGYGKTGDGKKYWKLKNSWGKLWGQGGYGMMARGKNMCSIANLASYPVLASPKEWDLSERSAMVEETEENLEDSEPRIMNDLPGLFTRTPGQ